MIIDFHTHVFPDAIAHQTITSMEQSTNKYAAIEGTLSALKQSMQQHHVDYSVVLPVATKPSQFDTINHFAAEINGKDGIFSFGGIHPDNNDIENKLSAIKSYGLKGVKLHPDFQNAYIDDKRYIEIIQACIQLDLCVVIHAGLDVGLPIPIHCPPDHTYIMLNEVLKDCKKDSKIVLAHLGGHMQWELVEHLLVGQNVYFDMAHSIFSIEQEQLLRIINNHGSDKILFGTDSPWYSQGACIDAVNALPISQEAKNNIFSENAKRLLDI